MSTVVQNGTAAGMIDQSETRADHRQDRNDDQQPDRVLHRRHPAVRAHRRHLHQGPGRLPGPPTDKIPNIETLNNLGGNARVASAVTGRPRSGTPSRMSKFASLPRGPVPRRRSVQRAASGTRCRRPRQEEEAQAEADADPDVQGILLPGSRKPRGGRPTQSPTASAPPTTAACSPGPGCQPSYRRPPPRRPRVTGTATATPTRPPMAGMARGPRAVTTAGSEAAARQASRPAWRSAAWPGGGAGVPGVDPGLPPQAAKAQDPRANRR